MKIALHQLDPVIGKPRANLKRILKSVSLVRADMHLCGELFLSGYYAQDIFFNQSIQREIEECAGEIENVSRETFSRIAVGLPRRNKMLCQKGLFNSIGVFGKDGFYQNKVCLPTYKEFDETRWFQSGKHEEVFVRKIGDEYFGFLICEDGWNSSHGGLPEKYRLYDVDLYEQLFDEAKTLGVTLSAFINISASTDYIGKQELRLKMFSNIAKHYQTPIIFVNIVGAQDELVFGGRSFVLNSQGDVVLEQKGFQEDVSIIETKLINQMKSVKTSYDSMRELDQMMGCYLKGYFKKSGLNNKKAIIGLSGGKDSTVVAIVLKRYLGADKVIGVMMPYRIGKYTSDLSKKIAEKLAKELRIDLREVEIDETVDSLVRSLKIQEGSLAHQNIQARARANVLWTIANNEEGIVINTTNFSEAAVGYGTIGGDLLGLPLIASIPATMVVEHLRWLKDNGEGYLENEMINRPPTAELAPNQFDSDDLGDYEYIDPILESLRMNYGDNRRVTKQLLDKSRKEYKKYWSNKNKFEEKLRFLSQKIINQTEFKRWYYNKTPQFTPFSWMRWKWPLANAEMNRGE